MAESFVSSYEELPYSRHAFYATHPDCLATVAALHGQAAPPVTRCRVLELGCASGGNLIPMAATLPEGRFVGLDLSPRQVAEGTEVVRALGLHNIELKALSILDVDASFGTFDYVICHGVYSWVPPPVQDKILQVCAAHLAPDGVAYVSYNTYPGWHLRGVVREMLGYHVGRFHKARLRVQQARAFLDFLAQFVRNPDGVYGRLLKKEAEMLADESDTYLFHEHLEDVNSPVYFHQFAERAAARGLQYLGEAQPSPLVSDLPAQAREILEQLAPERLTREQYLDFLSNRTFRRTLLCHDRVRLEPAPSWQAVSNLRLAALAGPVRQQPDVTGDTAEEFRTLRGGVTLTTNRPLIKATLWMLYEAWPRSVPFAALASGVRSRLGDAGGSLSAGDDSSGEELARTLLSFYLSNLVELHVHEPEFALQIGERPVASPLARLLGETDERVTNLRHRSVELTNFDGLVLRHLDGSRDRAALLHVLSEAVASGMLQIRQDDQPVSDAAQLHATLAEALEVCLQRLAGNALLLG
jgi:methyltransferase-like protein/2-polyprenyl-3-methyl-5-hydroxy-6-metoxy-1,4-benzoquinol methylase